MNVETFIRPSSIERLSLCPGAAQMSARFVEIHGAPPSSDVADIGTAVHEHAASIIAMWKDGASWENAIDTVCSRATTLGMDSWSVSCVRLCGEFYQALVAKYEADADNVLAEHQLDMGPFGFTRSGTADLVIVVPFKEVIVVDIKAGFIDQGDADEHDQLSVYSIAAAATFKCDRVTVVIFQPRLPRKDRPSVAVSDANTLRANAAWARAVTEEARKPDAELVPSYNACLYCPCLPRCPAAEDHIMRTLKAFELIGAPVTPEDWGNLIGAAKLAEKRADGVKDLGKARLRAGGAVNGFKLGAPRALRTVTQVPAALQRLEAAGMGQAAAEAISISLAKLPDAAEQVIADLITEKLSDPPLVATKSKAGVL